MAAIAPTYASIAGVSPNSNLVSVTAPVGSSSDTITLVQATCGIQSIANIVGWAITGGLDIAFCFLQVSFSGLVITVASFEQDGTVATDFTGTTIAVTVVGNT